MRSVYRLVQKTELAFLGDCSTSNELLPMWKGLWKMRVPYKIYLFAWRAYKEGLLSLQNLIKRKLN